MSNVLTQFFAKKGIKDINDLSAEERVTYDNYEKVLSKERLTIEDIEQFVSTQIEIIEVKWRDHSFAEKADLIPYHTCYKAILDALSAPQAERNNLERFLLSQLK